MLWLLNSVPVIGHLKGLIHYATGNPEEGNEAIYEATRSTMVYTGGFIGTFGGPVLSAGAAIYAGIYFDVIATKVTGEPQGNIKNITDIKNGFENGNFPLMSMASTILTVVTDGMSGALVNKLVRPTQGFVGNSVARAAPNSVTKQTAKSVTESAAPSVTKQAVDSFIYSAAVITPAVALATVGPVAASHLNENAAQN